MPTTLRVLATMLRPNTLDNYRKVTRCFLAYLRATFPRVRKLSQLRRDPHLLGWFRSLCQHQPPLGNESRLAYLLWLRRLLLDLADNRHLLQPDLIRRQDFPPRTRYLPRPLSLQDDQNLQAQLRQLDDLESNLLLLVRFTGIRIGECIDLPLDWLRREMRVLVEDTDVNHVRTDRSSHTFSVLVKKDELDYARR